MIRGALAIATECRRVHVMGPREFAIALKPSCEELLMRLRAFRGGIPADFKFDRDETNAR